MTDNRPCGLCVLCENVVFVVVKNVMLIFNHKGHEEIHDVHNANEKSRPRAALFYIGWLYD